MLVNWWVEKHQRFLFNVYKRFFLIFVTFLTFLTVFIFFLELFLHLWFRRTVWIQRCADCGPVRLQTQIFFDPQTDRGRKFYRWKFAAADWSEFNTAYLQLHADALADLWSKSADVSGPEISGSAHLWIYEVRSTTGNDKTGRFFLLAGGEMWRVRRLLGSLQQVTSLLFRQLSLDNCHFQLFFQLRLWQVCTTAHNYRHALTDWGVDFVVWGSWPLKICSRGQTIFWAPYNVTFFHSKLLLDNSASFTSRTKELCQKRKVKLIFRGASRLSGTENVGWLEIIDVGCNLKQFDGLTWLTLLPQILR